MARVKPWTKLARNLENTTISAVAAESPAFACGFPDAHDMNFVKSCMICGMLCVKAQDPKSFKGAAADVCLALVAMACLSTSRTLAVPEQLSKHADSDVESTVAAEHSDIETVEDSCPSELPSPRSSGMADASDEEEGSCNVFVRSTFIDVDDGRSLMQRYRQLRRTMTDSVFLGAWNFAEEEAYEPGRFSDERAKAEATAPSAPSTPPCSTPPCTPPSTPEAKPVQVAKASKEAKQAERTTLMLRNVPNNCTREMFLGLLDEHGFAGRYDFVYLPCDFYRQANLGYAFVNLVDSAAVDALWAAFDGFSDWPLPTAKVCQVSWSGPHQGFKVHGRMVFVGFCRIVGLTHVFCPKHVKPALLRHTWSVTGTAR